MNIEEAIKKLKGYLNWIEANGSSKVANDSAIETLLTAYEKEKEENKRLRKCHLQYEEMTGIDLLLPEKEE